MKEAIQKAIEGGWNPTCYPDKEGEPVIKVLEDVIKNKPVLKDVTNFLFSSWGETATLDPLFWQALGKAEGWGKTINLATYYQKTTDGKEHTEKADYEEWVWQWYRFIDHLAEGKSIDEFFNNLLK